jgi:hypothetical protein
LEAGEITIVVKRKQLWLIGLLLLTALAACGGNVPAATALPTNQIYQSNTAGGDLSFYYPAGWVVSTNNGQIIVANSQTAMDASAPSSGQFRIQMLPGPISAFGNFDAQTVPSAVIQYLLPRISTQGVQYSSSTDLTIGAYPASRAKASAGDGEGSITAVNMGNGIYNIVSASSAAGELAQFQPTLDAILATVLYSAPVVKPGQAAPAATAEAAG